MMTPPYVVIQGRRRVPLSGPRRWTRGALAVARLLLSAAEVLLSAVTGWRRPSHVARQVAATWRDAWRAARPRPTRSPIPPPSIISVVAVEEDTTDGR